MEGGAERANLLLLQRGRRDCEYDASGNELRSYGYQPDSTWTTDPLWLKQGTEYYFYQNDHLGTSAEAGGVNGAVVWSAQYMAFGEAVVDVSTVTNNLVFSWGSITMKRLGYIIIISGIMNRDQVCRRGSDGLQGVD